MTILRCSLGDLDVQHGWLRLALRGNWIAHVEVSASDLPIIDSAAAVVVQRTDGSEDSFIGTVRRADMLEGAARVDVTVVGGAGGLIVDADPREHAQGSLPVPAGVIAKSIADAAGETLAEGVEDALDAFLLPRWTRLEIPGGVSLSLLADALGLEWRMLADGTVWIGSDTWADVDASSDLTTGDPRDGSLLYAPDGAPYRPGTTIDGVRATSVEYMFTPSRTRVRVGKDVTGDPVRVADRTLYRSSYVGEVKKQNDDGTLDIVPDDTRLPELLSVPLRLGLPHGKVTVIDDNESRVRVYFEGADPRGAYATSIDQDTSADKGVVRVDDVTNTGKLEFSLSVDPVGLLITHRQVNGIDVTYRISATAGATPVTFAITPVPPASGPPYAFDLAGKNVTGHPRVFLTSEGQV